jgi:hypothetical protein
MMPSQSLILSLVAVLALVALAASGHAASWEEVQKIKQNCMESGAKHAMEQQKTTEAGPVAIPFPDGLVAAGGMKITAKSADAVTLDIVAAPTGFRKDPTETLRIDLAQPIDMVKDHSGLAIIVEVAAGASPEVRLGCRLIGADGKQAVILPIVPALSRWGDNPHEVYLDWAFINYANVEDAVAVLRQVKTIELTAGSRQRAPQRGDSTEPRKATVTLRNLRLVDYLRGSFDPSRRWLQFDEAAGKWVPGEKDLTLQHRCQEVTGVAATFGGEAGVRAAVASLDHAARTQCWDGSFLDGRRGANTVASGEYTFGFTLYGLLNGYVALEKQKCPALDEKVIIGAATPTRREAYQRMFYRGAMARTAALPSDYRDDIIGGDTLMTGANRVLGYAIAMRMIADVLTDPARKQEVLAAYQPIMKQIADAQGKYSGGFPVLGEGDKYQGKGIHYDGGYTRTHMDWLVAGVQRTGDPLLVEMLRRYQTVFEAAMNSEGTGLKKLISERHPGGGDVELILPDATAQVGLKHGLPIIAQWGYNCGIPVWNNWEKQPGNHFSFASHARGYSLGAHIGILMDDLVAAPQPKDLGYLFPRQFPIWSSRLYTKDGKLQRTSSVSVGQDGKMTNDFRIEVGEYPVTVGVPVAISVTGGAVTVTADKLTGWPKLLPEGAAIQVSVSTSQKPRREKIGQPFQVAVPGEVIVTITGPEITLPPEVGGGKVPFLAELTIRNVAAAGTDQPAAVLLTVLRGTVPYTHEFTAEKK